MDRHPRRTGPGGGTRGGQGSGRGDAPLLHQAPRGQAQGTRRRPALRSDRRPRRGRPAQRGRADVAGLPHPLRRVREHRAADRERGARPVPAPRTARRPAGDPARLPAATEEFLRYEGPALLAIRRFPVEDVTISGVTIPAGETVWVSPSAANRDPERFSDPDRLDLARDASGHLALGHGIHYCLGAPLARAETEIALAALLERFPDLALAEPTLRWRNSLRARGLLALQVSY